MQLPKLGRGKHRHSDDKAAGKVVGRIVLTIMLIAFLYVSITFFQVYTYAREDGVDKNTDADAILVLGAAQYNGKPSGVLKARLDHALDLYKRNVAPLIIVTGGNQDGDNFTEASASANYLLERGVPDEKILREVNGVSTYDSLRDAAHFAKEQGIKKVVLVTDGFHTLRSSLIARNFGLSVVPSPTKTSPITGGSEWKHFISETGRVSLGRIIGFRRVSKDSALVNFVKHP